MGMEDFAIRCVSVRGIRFQTRLRVKTDIMIN